VQWKIPGQLCFSGQAQVVQKSWIIKIHIQYSKFRAPSVIPGKRKLLESSECKKYIQYSEKFQGNSVFRASAGYSKLLNNKKYIQYSEKFQGTLCFSGQEQVAQKSWIIKKYIQYSEFRTPSVFQGKRKLFKNSEWKKYIPYSEKFQGNSVFSGQVLVDQNSWMYNVYSIQWKIPGKLCFFRASAGYSKLLNNKKYIFGAVNSGNPLFFRASASCSKNQNVKSILMQWKISGQLCFFRASASCSKIVNVKRFSIQCIFTWGRFVQFGLV